MGRLWIQVPRKKDAPPEPRRALGPGPRDPPQPPRRFSPQPRDPGAASSTWRHTSPIHLVVSLVRLENLELVPPSRTSIGVHAQQFGPQSLVDFGSMQQTTSNFSREVVGFQPLNHNKQKCRICRNNNHDCVPSLSLRLTAGSSANWPL